MDRFTALVLSNTRSVPRGAAAGPERDDAGGALAHRLHRAGGAHLRHRGGAGCVLELETNLHEVCSFTITITERVPTRAFSWLNVSVSAFTI